MFDLIIKNGMIVNAQESHLADLAVTGGKIMEIAPEIQEPASMTIDAEGKYVLPGLVDARTHFSKAREGLDPAVELAQGSRAALFGGVTSILEEVDFTAETKNFTELLRHAQDLMDGHCYTDYSFHGRYQKLDSSFLDELQNMAERGISSLNATLCGPEALGTEDLSRIFVCGAAAGTLICIHPESEEAIASLEKVLVQNHLTSPYYHAISRPNLTEAQAVAQSLSAAAAAGDAPIYLQQITCRESLAQIRAARARGQRNIHVETCTHYLLLNNLLSTKEDSGARYVVNPPLRSPADNRALWEALSSGLIQCLASDHYGYSSREKENPRPNEKWDFRHCPPGLPGVRHRLDLLYHYGVGENRLSIERLVAVCSSNPARIFGLYPRKGLLAPGSDADIVIYDAELSQRLSELHGGSDFCPYAGWRLQGGVSSVLLRGKLLVDRGALLEEKARGIFLPREKSILDADTML
ncbi:MAG: amidohydrolase family protein [Bacillota bacterium]|nr:amidohydrolase family protein [Bacillota bacterium]